MRNAPSLVALVCFRSCTLDRSSQVKHRQLDPDLRLQIPARIVWKQSESGCLCEGDVLTAKDHRNLET